MIEQRLIDYWSRLLTSKAEDTIVIRPDGTPVSCREIDLTSKQTAEALQTPQSYERKLAILHGSNPDRWLADFISCLRLNLVIIPVDWNLSQAEARLIGERLGASLYLKDNNWETIDHGSNRRIQSVDIVLGKLTSGSTGTPQCLFFTDSELIEDGKRLIDCMGIRSEDINMGVIPWGHSYGLGNIVMPLLIQGTRATWCDSPFPHDISATIERTKSTIFPAVPTLLAAINGSDIEVSQLNSLRLVISAGSRLAPQVAQSFHDRFGLIPHNFYGSSETGGICYDPTGDVSLSGKGIGKVIPGVQLIPKGGDRFLVCSSSVFTYGNRRPRIEGDGAFLMVDSGKISSDGIVILGNRVKGFAKIGGKRINLSEVEDLLKKSDAISNALVFEQVGEANSTLVAAIETDLPENELPALIKAAISRRIMRPKQFACFSQFPTTPRGKINTQAIRKQLGL